MSASRELEPQGGRPLTLHDALAIWRRRRGLALCVLLAMALVTILLVSLLPPSYQARATILIEQQEIPQDLVRSTITSYADQRLQVINQRVMSTQNLIDVADKFNLYPRERDDMPREELVSRVRDSVTFKIISADVMDPRRGVPTRAAIAFEVAFEDRSAQTAYRVANELASLYLDENLKNRTEQAEETSAFLADEADRLDGRVMELEGELARFKERHYNELPELTQTNWRLLDRTREELRAVKRAISDTDEKVLYLESQLARLNPMEGIFSETGARVMSSAERLASLRVQEAQLSNRYSADHPDMVRIRREIQGLANEVSAADQSRELRKLITQKRGELATIRQRYSDDHPDVALLTSQIRAVMRLLEEHAVSGGDAVEATNPAYIQVEANVESARLERASLLERQEYLVRREADLESRIERAPFVESQYRDLARKYQNNAAKLVEIRAKLLEAELAESMEAGRKGERLTLVDPPQIPEQPVSPNRPLVLMLGLALSLGTAFGGVVVSEALDPRLFGVDQVTSALGLTPLGSVPVIRTRSEIARSRVRRYWAAAGAASVVLALATTVHMVWLPLDTLVFSMLNRFGM